MSIEEKAKAYDEALERARADYNNHLEEGYKNYREHLETIFPELREKPLTSFQQCLNCILRGVYYAAVPDKKVNEFILNVVRTRTDELVRLAKRHEYTDCQLRESEDERIRKYLIDELKTAKSVGELKFTIPEQTREECISWLEKQKEPTKEELYAEAGTTEKEYIANTMKMVRAMREKQKEQKPENKEITLTNFEEVLNTFLFDFANSPIEDCEPKEYTKKHSAEILKAAYAELNAQLKQDIFEAQQEGRREGYEAAKAEQKPAEWSEEDIKNFNKISAILLDASEVKCWWEKSRIIEKDEMNKLTEWLNLVFNSKLLRPQPKQEWSESDDLMLQTVYETLYDYQSGIRTGTMGKIDRDYVAAIDKQIAWLKSLRPQPHWKPSEDQMDALKELIDDANKAGWVTPGATELYEQLKKL